MSYNVKFHASKDLDVILASKDYVDLRIQALKDALISHEQNTDTAHTSNSETVLENAGLLDKEELTEFPSNRLPDDLAASSVEQDAKHRFLTDTQIQTFKNKPSLFEMQNAIEDAKSELKSTFNDLYVNLLNMPDAVDRLKIIANFVESSDVMQTILKEIGSRATEEELEDHASSNKHLTNNDRKALNLLLEYINNGFMEKIPDIGKTADYADTAGDAETLEGFHANDLMRCHLENTIYGSALGSSYSDKDANFILETRDKDGQRMLDSLLDQVGLIAFKNGVYLIKDGGTINFHRANDLLELIIRGAGNATRFGVDTKVDLNNVTLENLSIEGLFEHTPVEIYNKVKLKDTTFIDCHIIFKDSKELLMTNCTFKGCTFEFGPNCAHMIITNNFFNNGPLPKFLSKTCAISNNVEF